MEFTLYELLISFLFSIILGFFLGIAYEPIRLFHKIGFKSGFIYFVCDVVFMIFCALVTFYYLLATLEGSVRVFVFVGEIIGFVTFYHTLGRLLDIIFTPIFKILKKISKKLLKTAGKVMYNIRIKLKYGMDFLRNRIVKVRLNERQKSGIGERKLLRKQKRHN